MVALDGLLDDGAKLTGTANEKDVTDTDARRHDQLGQPGGVLVARARRRTAPTTSACVTRAATT